MSTIYNELYEQACAIFEDGLLCEDCLKGDACCGGCSYLTKDGCTTQSIFCKLWICQTIEERAKINKILLKKLNELNEIKRIAISYGIYKEGRGL